MNVIRRLVMIEVPRPGRLRQNLTFNVFLVSCNVCTYIPQPFPFGPFCWMKMASCIAILFKSLARIVVFIISWRHCNTQLFSGKNTFILIDLMMQPMSVPCSVELNVHYDKMTHFDAFLQSTRKKYFQTFRSHSLAVRRKDYWGVILFLLSNYLINYLLIQY